MLSAGQLVLRWLIDGVDLHILVRDARIDRLPDRYLKQTIDFIAANAPT